MSLVIYGPIKGTNKNKDNKFMFCPKPFNNSITSTSLVIKNMVPLINKVPITMRFNSVIEIQAKSNRQPPNKLYIVVNKG